MKKLIVILMCTLSVPAFAAGKTCYSTAQFRAEQAIRYHTTLMVTGMRCMSMQKTAYVDYQSFTNTNQSVIRSQENQLIGYFKQTKKSGAERAFHTFRTDLANRISMEANGTNYSPFCTRNVAQLNLAKAMGPKEFQGWVNAADLKTPQTTHPLCDTTKAPAKKAKKAKTTKTKPKAKQ